jgi:hypothetical protein
MDQNYQTNDHSYIHLFLYQLNSEIETFLNLNSNLNELHILPSKLFTYDSSKICTFHGIEVSCSLFLDVILSFHCYSSNKAKTKRDVFSSYVISIHFGSLTYIVLTFFMTLVTFMPTKPNGDLRSFDYTKEERWTLATSPMMLHPNLGHQSNKPQLIM